MFGGLKNKLKKVVTGFSKKVEEAVEEKVIETLVVEEAPKPKTQTKKKEKPAKTKPKEEIVEEPKKQGFLSKLKKKVSNISLSDDKFEELFWELEIELLEIGVAVEVIEKIKEDLKENLVKKEINKKEIENTIKESLTKTLTEVLSQEPFDIIKKIKEKKPTVICFIGVNGTGKTTTIAKFVHLLQKNNLSTVLAASDTFRAAAIDQLKSWATKLNTKLIAHEYGSDPAAVAFDAVEHAKANHLNTVIIDTAGRLHANTDLMNELKKIIRVAKPDLKIFVGESITGNDCIEQAEEFNKAVGIDGIILSKADIDDKGGAAISVSHVTKKPILYLGTGQELDDLKPFDKEKIIKGLGLK